MSDLRFCAGTEDLMSDALGRPALTPSMRQIVAADLRKPIGSEIAAFNATLYSLEKNSGHFRRHSQGSLDDGGKGWIEYLDMQYGLTAWLDQPTEFEPLTWLALSKFLIEYRAPYPKSLIATLEYFLSDWDAEAYSNKLEFMAPAYVRECVSTLSTQAKAWMNSLESHDLY